VAERSDDTALGGHHRLGKRRGASLPSESGVALRFPPQSIWSKVPTRNPVVVKATREPWPESGAKAARTPDAVAQIRRAIACAERLECDAFATAFGVGLSMASRFKTATRVLVVVEALHEPEVRVVGPRCAQPARCGGTSTGFKASTRL